MRRPWTLGPPPSWSRLPRHLADSALVDAPRRPLRRRPDTCGGGGGSGGAGKLVVSEAPEPSFGIAGQVLLELEVAGFIEHLKGHCVLVITYTKLNTQPMSNITFF